MDSPIDPKLSEENRSYQKFCGVWVSRNTVHLTFGQHSNCWLASLGWPPRSANRIPRHFSLYTPRAEAAFSLRDSYLEDFPVQTRHPLWQILRGKGAAWQPACGG